MLRASRRRPAGNGALRTGLRHAVALLGERRGAAAVEFAFAAPVLIVFAVGAIEFSRFLWTDYALDYAAEQAARFVLANPTASPTQIQTVAAGQVPTVKAQNVTVTVSYDTTNGVNFVTVTASTPFTSITSLVPIGNFTLSGRSRMPIG